MQNTTKEQWKAAYWTVRHARRYPGESYPWTLADAMERDDLQGVAARVRYETLTSTKDQRRASARRSLRYALSNRRHGVTPPGCSTHPNRWLIEARRAYYATTGRTFANLP